MSDDLKRDDSNKPTDTYEVVSSPARKPTFGQKVKRHCARFWWLHLLIFAACTLIITLPLIYVGFPNIAQHDVDDSSLIINSQVVTDPQPSSVHFNLNNTAKSSSMYHPHLDSFQAALFLENTEPDIQPFGYMTIPATHVQSEFAIIVDQTLNITDMDQFIAYNKLVMNSEVFRVAVRGRVGLHQTGLHKITVNYNKVITMNGLNKLTGFEVYDLSANLSAADGEPNLFGMAYIPNPSVMTLELGNVTMDLAVKGTPIGQSLLPNLTLKPGDNNVTMQATSDVQAVLELLNDYPSGILPVTITGNSSVNSNGDHLPYYEAAIQDNVLSIQLDVNALIGGSG